MGALKSYPYRPAALRIAYQPRQLAARFGNRMSIGHFSNDRSGFRNGAALAFHPWNIASEQAMSLKAWPMILTDSHLYDYADDQKKRRSEISRWLDEVFAVGGQASVQWHQRVMSPDYGRGDLYAELIRALEAHACVSSPSVTGRPQSSQVA